MRNRSNCGSRSSDRELWRKRIDNPDSISMPTSKEENIKSNIDNIAEAMGMSKISFDNEAN